MAGNNSILILRGTVPTQNVSLLDGQPYYNKTTRELHVGDSLSYSTYYEKLYMDTRLNSLYTETKVCATFNNNTVWDNNITSLIGNLVTNYKLLLTVDTEVTYHFYGHHAYSHSYDDFSLGSKIGIKKVNLIGYGDATLDLTASELMFRLASTENLTVKNLNFLDSRPNAHNVDWTIGYIVFLTKPTATITIENCSFLLNGLRLLYGNNITISRCKFNLTNLFESRYGLWLGSTAFSSTNDGYSDHLVQVTIKDCDFTGYRGIKFLTNTRVANTLHPDAIDSLEFNIIGNTFHDIRTKQAIVFDSKYNPSSFSVAGGSKSKVVISSNHIINCPKGFIENNVSLNYTYVTDNLYNPVSYNSVSKDNTPDAITVSLISDSIITGGLSASDTITDTLEVTDWTSILGECTVYGGLRVPSDNEDIIVLTTGHDGKASNFKLKYLGTGSGVTNYLSLTSQRDGEDITLVNVHNASTLIESTIDLYTKLNMVNKEIVFSDDSGSVILAKSSTNNTLDIIGNLTISENITNVKDITATSISCATKPTLNNAVVRYLDLQECYEYINDNDHTIIAVCNTTVTNGRKDITTLVAVNDSKFFYYQYEYPTSDNVLSIMSGIYLFNTDNRRIRSEDGAAWFFVKGLTDGKLQLQLYCNSSTTAKFIMYRIV